MQKFFQLQSQAWIDNSPVCTKIVDLDLNLQFISRAGACFLGFSDPADYYGKPYPFAFYPDEFKGSMIKALRQAIETEQVVEYEGRAIDIHGDSAWFHSTITPVSESKKSIDYLLVVSLDTTQQNETRIALENLNASLEQQINERTQELLDINEKLQRQNETDYLTGLWNRFSKEKQSK